MTEKNSARYFKATIDKSKKVYVLRNMILVKYPSFYIQTHRKYIEFIFSIKMFHT